MTDDVIEIRYKRPKFHRLILANMIDLFFLVALTILNFFIVKSISNSFPDMVRMNNFLDETKLASTLYKKNSKNQIVDIITILDNDKNLSSGQRLKEASKTIDSFLTYLDNQVGENYKNEVLTHFNDYCLNEKFVYNGEPYFIKDNDDVIKNTACKVGDIRYYEDIYKPYIDSPANTFFIQYAPNYLNTLNTVGRVIIFLEIPISYCLSAFIVYVVPIFIFRRGHKTLGKLIYRIGLVDDKTFFNVSTKKMVIRTLIVYFGEVVLSIYTLAIPLIVSFSMMVFSRKHRSFPNYMVGIEEVDCTSENIYNSFEDIKIEELSGTKEPIDFKSIR